LIKTLLPRKQPSIKQGRGLVLTKRTTLALTLMVSVLISLVSVVNAPSSSSSTPSVPPAMEWDTFYGAKSGLTGSQLIQTSDGGYAAAGNTRFNITNAFWLIKTDAKGNALWNQTYWAGSVMTRPNVVVGDNSANSVVQTADGGYALAGHAWVHSADMHSSWTEALLVKTDSLGNIVWNQTFSEYASVYSIIQTSDGGLAFAGNAQRYWSWQAWIVKLDASGNAEWNQTYPNRSGGGDGWTAYRLIETSDGGFALAGSWKHTSSVNYYFLVKTEPALPPPTPTPTPSSPPSTGFLSEENLALFASLAVAAVLIAVVAVAVFRRRKKQTLPASFT
jgi:hypothetical protein